MQVGEPCVEIGPRIDCPRVEPDLAPRDQLVEVLDVKPLTRRRPRRALELAHRTAVRRPRRATATRTRAAAWTRGSDRRATPRPRGARRTSRASRRSRRRTAARTARTAAPSSAPSCCPEPGRAARPIVVNFSRRVRGIAAEVVVRALRARDHAADVRIARIGTDLERAVEQLVGAPWVRARRVEHRLDQQRALEVLAVPGLQRHPQVAGLEVHAADRVDHREARRGRLEDLELEHLGIGDLAAVALAKPEAAEAHARAVPQQRRDHAARRLRRCDADLAEQRLERRPGPARCGR